MRAATPLKDAYEFARRKHGDDLENWHLLQATLLSQVIRHPSSTPHEKHEAKRQCLQELRALTGGETAV